MRLLPLVLGILMALVSFVRCLNDIYRVSMYGLPPDLVSDQIHLYGEPKSGTSWVGYVAETMLMRLCTPHTPYKFQKWVQFTLEEGRNHTKPSPFGCIMPKQKFKAKVHILYELVNREKPIWWTSSWKHHVGNTDKWPPCRHVNFHPVVGTPCLMHKDGHTFDSDAIAKIDLTSCVRRCLRLEKHRAIYVIRDPRDTAVSMCNYEEHKEKYFNGSMSRCLKKLYPRVVLWTKFREMIIDRPRVQEKTTVVCYEAMISKDNEVVLQVYKDILNGLGLILPSDESSQKAFHGIINETSEESLRSNLNKTRYVKLSSWSQKHFTSESHNIPVEVIEWMNSTYNIVEKKYVSSPCYPFRDAVGLYSV